jgi:cytochrome c biogenesis factor
LYPDFASWLLALCAIHKEATPRRTDIMGIYDFMLSMVIIMIIVLSLKK